MFFFKSLFIFSFVYSCMDQYDPRPYWEQFTRERKVSNSEHLKLSDTGERIATVDELNSAPKDPIHEKFTSFCSSCHGVNGMGDGVAATGLNPKPRNFHDKTWQAKVDDARISKVIREGGASVGLSSTMVAWGNQLKPQEIEGIVKLIRSFGQD